jgi:hypothetical protein
VFGAYCSGEIRFHFFLGYILPKTVRTQEKGVVSVQGPTGFPDRWIKMLPPAETSEQAIAVLMKADLRGCNLTRVA